jgi:ribosomal protein S27AE
VAEAPHAPASRPVEHLHVWRCRRCGRTLFEHGRPLDEVAEALGVVRLKCGNCNFLNVLPRER